MSTTTPTDSSSPHMLFLFFLAFFMVMIPAVIGCIQKERESLLEFKAGLQDLSGRLSSWAGDDCCSWRGVKCDNKTGHVVRLTLPNTFFGSAKKTTALGGDINPSLLGLEHLEHLDLSGNSFKGIRIPSFIGSLRSLRYLNLSGAGFNGSVPHQLGNLSSLHYLDISAMNTFPYTLYVDTGRWLSYLSSLKYLNMAYVDLSRASNLVESLNGLPSLSVMYLSNCELSTPLHLPHVNFTSLSVLDLSINGINSTILPWMFKITGLKYLNLRGNNFQSLVPASIGNLTSLAVLDLSYNGFIEGIPEALGKLCALSELDLSGNKFGGKLDGLGATFSGCIQDSLKTLTWNGGELTGQLPDWLGKIKNLKYLDLSDNSFYGSFPNRLSSSLQLVHLQSNKLNGTISETIGQLSELVELDLSNNKLEGVLSEAHFSNLTSLAYLYLDSNSLVLDVGSDWIPPLRLTDVTFGSCKLGPRFPTWLRELKNLSSISISNAGISDAMPDWFWNFSSAILDIDLSHNEIKGMLPSSLRHLNLRYVDLSHNRFKGPFPQFSSRLQELRLSNNLLSGTIYPNIGELVPSMMYLGASANNLSGNIPLSICKLEQLITLDLSENHLSGEIPNCWDQNQELMALDLANNNLSGGIPTLICSIASFQSLHLSGNNLSGDIPLTLRSCNEMTILDLGQNKFSGIIPSWIGESLLMLEGLRLRSNLFVGNIPPQLGNLENLQVIDLAHNNLSGTIPRSFGNLSAMKAAHSIYQQTYLGYVDNLNVNMKGRDEEYATLLPLLMSIDLACNNLTGGIPDELTTLSGLQNLNLSGNHLTGKITEKISELQMLESLDLSFNNLSGAIPTTMVTMHSLNTLNMSFNDFFGEIPSGGQLQALPDPSIYIGNHGLCGFPLSIKCPHVGTSQLPQPHDGTSQLPQPGKSDESDSEMVGFYISIGSGFVVGLWIVYGNFLFNKKWRIAYFRFVDDIYDKIYVVLATSMAKMKNQYKSNGGG